MPLRYNFIFWANIYIYIYIYDWPCFGDEIYRPMQFAHERWSGSQQRMFVLVNDPTLTLYLHWLIYWITTTLAIICYTPNMIFPHKCTRTWRLILPNALNIAHYYFFCFAEFPFCIRLRGTTILGPHAHEKHKLNQLQYSCPKKHTRSSVFTKKSFEATNNI